MNKAQSDALTKLEKLTGKTHQKLEQIISHDRVVVILDDMVRGIIDEDGSIRWSYTRGFICDECRHSFTPKEVEA